MGVSTDAILVFGVALGDYDEHEYQELPWATDEDEEFEDTLCRRLNVPSYGDKFDNETYEKRKAILDPYPITLVRHCHYDYPMWVLGLKSTELAASWGYPVQFESLPEVPANELRELLKFLEEFGIEDEPQWVLCSDWG